MSTVTARSSVARTTIVLVLAAAIAVLANAFIATIAVALGAPASYGPLTLPAYATFTILGVVAGWVGWRIVRARARRPRRVLSWLVPVVAVLSFVPDVILLVVGFIPGTTPIAVVALMLMHVVVIAVAVPAYAIVAPVE